MPALTEVSFSSYNEVRRCFVISAAINGVLYGCFLSLAGVALIRLKSMKTLTPRTFSRMAKFVLVVCLVYTAFVVGMSIQVYKIIFPAPSPLWTQLPMLIAFGSLTVATGLGDLLFLYRTWIIWGRSRYVIIPFALFCMELVVQLSADILVAIDHGGLSKLTVSSVGEKLAITGMIIGLVLNFLLSAAAIGRLLLARKHLREAALPNGGNHYIQISRLLVATTALYTAAWLTLLIARRSIYSTVTIAVVFAVCCTCPLVILLHVAGRTQADTLVLPEIEAAPASLRIVELSVHTQPDPRTSVASADRMPTFKSSEMVGTIDPRPGILWYQSNERCSSIIFDFKRNVDSVAGVLSLRVEEEPVPRWKRSMTLRCNRCIHVSANQIYKKHNTTERHIRAGECCRVERKSQTGKISKVSLQNPRLN